MITKVDKEKFIKLGYYQVYKDHSDGTVSVQLVKRKDYYRRLLIKRL